MSASARPVSATRSRWRVLLAAAALGLAACGGGGVDPGAEAGAAAATSTPAAAATTAATAGPAAASTSAALAAASTMPADAAAVAPAVAAAAAPVAPVGAAPDTTTVAAAVNPLAEVAGPSAGAGTTATLPAPTMLAADALAVVYDEGDATSEAIARAYQAARGIPAQQVVGVRLPAGVGHSIGAEDFVRLKADLDARLGERVQALLVTWSRPSRVTGPCTMSLTSALAFGFDARHCGGCNRTAVSPYYDHDTAQPWTTLRMRPAMMLGVTTTAEANALIARGLASDGSMRGGRPQGWLVRTSDAARSVRWPDFVQTAAGAIGGVDWQYLDNSAGTGSNTMAGAGGVMFYLTGLVRVPQLESVRWLPGAVADHLTSYGGVLPDGAGQMPATAWIVAGATGSYGTVEEPCNYLQKFPRASVLARRYGRGEALIEAYWKSVQWPGQGLFVGDPLARPWPRT